MRLSRAFGVACGMLLAACQADPKSPAGLRLPPGDVEKGRATFSDLKCHACHRVYGGGFPEPTVDPPVPVVLGGPVPHVRTDGDLVTAIVNPSHRLAAGYKKDDLVRDGRSRMPDCTQTMTVAQLIDLVAFLQARYQVVRPGRNPD
jgi:sulfur-oxidizing protein SoxX